MNALLIIAHGSRSREANAEVARLAERTADGAGTAFDRVVYAYLEIAEPKVDAAVAALAAEGTTHITVFPFFLAGGTHVTNDIPACIAAAEIQHPEVRFKILPHLGALEGIPSLIVREIS